MLRGFSYYDAGYYDGLGWKRFIPFGSNLALKNPIGVLETVNKVINQYGTAGGGMSDSKWLTNATNFPILSQALDGNASFTAGYKTENDPLTVITFSDIKNYLNSAPGVFGTWDPIYYRYDNSSTRNSVDNHDMPAIGYIENYSKWSITANWLLTKSTWTNNADGDMDPLWFNYDADVDLSDNVTYGYFAAGGSPSSLSDTTDDLYEDNDYRGDASAILLPFSDSSLKCNDHDWFKLTNVSAGATINATTNFTHANGDLDLTLWNSSGIQVGLSESTNNQEGIVYTAPSTGDYYIKVYGYNGAKNSYSMSVTVMGATTPPAVEFSAASSSGSEATTPAALTVTLSAASSQTVTVNYTTANGTATAGSDYTATSGTLTFNPGVSSQTINVPIINDSTIEGDETFTVTLSAPVNATLGSIITHTYTINNDDVAAAGTIQLSSATYSVPESGPTVTITATRTGGSSEAVGISYATSDGTAAAGSDYTAASGTLSWANGDTANKTFTVLITNDTLDELDESFVVTLSNPTGGATFGSPASATVTIADDDAAPTVQFSSASSSGSEATTPAAITVTLSAVSGQTVTVNYATANGTATAGSDYTITSGTLTFNSGETSQTINVPITNDTIIETNETFTVTLSSSVNATLGTTITHTYTINNDDSYGSFQLSSATYSVSEGEGTVTITATRTGGSSGGVSFSYWILNGTATDYADYRLVYDTLNQAKGGRAYGPLIDAANNTAGSGWLSWADGDTADKFITVAIINDTLNEQNETFSVGLNTNSVSMSAVVGQDPSARPLFGSPNSATVTIIDDDTADPNSAYVNPLGTCSGKLPCYSTIQAAIDASADGATITISQGTYHENILINKTLILSGGWNSSVTTQSADPALPF